jgi:hypothetical protein
MDSLKKIKNKLHKYVGIIKVHLAFFSLTKSLLQWFFNVLFFLHNIQY